MPPVSEFAIERFGENRSEITVNAASATLRRHAAPQFRVISNDAEPVDGVATPLGGFAKRSFDVSIASIALILMAPIMAIISALIFLTMGGAIFFKQSRVGFDGRMFGCLKFRSMVKNADEVLKHHLENSPDAKVEWELTQKLRDDPRITWLGSILRKSSLDELPQLFNIVRGDMSCIGPRPVLSKELERYGVYGTEYKRARPGLTGLWQVSGRSNTTYAERVKLDRLYVRRWSIFLDFVILLRTIPALLKFDETV
jgi:exopolysaccharide production protein ExoY